MSDNMITANQRAEVAAKHLVGNLWYNLESVPLLAAKLPPAIVRTAVSSPAALAYSEMCRLLQSTDETLSAGHLEANLRTAGFDFNWLISAQADIANDGIEDLYRYAGDIRNAADLHELKANCAQVLQESNDPSAKADKLKASLMTKLVSVERVDGAPRHVGEIIQSVRKGFEDMKMGVSEWGASTGLRSLDSVFRLVDGSYITIGARPSMGKTSLLMWLLYNRAVDIKRSGEPGQVLLFSLDDTEEKLIRSLACTVAMVDLNRLRKREATAEEWQKVEDAMQHIASLPLYIDDQPGLTVEDIHYRVALQNIQSPVRLIASDYIEKIKNRQYKDNDLGRLRANADGCKSIGKLYGAPYIQLSQITKDVESRADRWPTSSDLKYAGEEESDVIVLLNRPEHYIGKGENISCSKGDESNIVLVNVAKNKEGKVGLVRLGFRKEYSRFADLQIVRHDLNDH